jgi:hypothetical protein
MPDSCRHFQENEAIVPGVVVVRVARGWDIARILDEADPPIEIEPAFVQSGLHELSVDDATRDQLARTYNLYVPVGRETAIAADWSTRPGVELAQTVPVRAPEADPPLAIHAVEPGAVVTLHAFTVVGTGLATETSECQIEIDGRPVDVLSCDEATAILPVPLNAGTSRVDVTIHALRNGQRSNPATLTVLPLGDIRLISGHVVIRTTGVDASATAIAADLGFANDRIERAVPDASLDVIESPGELKDRLARYYAVTVPPGLEMSRAEHYLSHPLVEYAAPVIAPTLAATPNDPAFPGPPAARSGTQTSRGVPVAGITLFLVSAFVVLGAAAVAARR